MTCNDNSYPRKQARHKMSTSLLEEHNIRFMVWVIQYHFYSLQWRTATLIVIKRHFHLSNMKKYYIVYRSGNLIPLLTLTEVELFKKKHREFVFMKSTYHWNQRITSSTKQSTNLNKPILIQLYLDLYIHCGHINGLLWQINFPNRVNVLCYENLTMNAMAPK